ncbi:MAG: PQQ-binding-like beta-propeller repeat protein [Devosia nanyangense]|jgi:alcohol dehydrogenase (cytochrome c)|nr:PQQ-binding-like beta-propeller repeat protein [Devosia nanyangense]
MLQAIRTLALASALLWSGAALSAPASGDWVASMGDLAATRYSPLDDIDRSNVDRLRTLYSVVLGGAVEGGGNARGALPYNLLVRDGYLYAVDGWGAVNKLDLRNKGKPVWRADAGQRNLDTWLQAHKGLALHEGYVISGGADGSLRWIDDATGMLVRTVSAGDPLDGYSLSAPPLVVDGKVLVAGSGPDRGGPLQFDAFDAASGEHLWRADLGDARGLRGSVLQAASYDASSGTLYWGIAMPTGPLPDEERDIWFGNGVVALDVAEGTVKWQHRYEEGTSGATNEAGPYHVVGAEDGGPLLGHFDNEGRYRVFNAGDGAEAVVAPLFAEGAEGSCANVRAAAAFNSAFSLRTGLIYGANAGGCLQGHLPIKTPSRGDWLGAYYRDADNALGILTAADAATGEVRAQHVFDFPLHAGATATAGGLVFVTTAEGTLHALDDESLEPLWSSHFGSLSSAPPLVFSVDGRQFVAVVVGGNALAGEISYRRPELGMSEGLMVLVVLGIPEAAR